MHLQKGMNFGIGKGYSIILMSQRRNAPYRDKIEDDGLTLIYEEHDQPSSKNSQFDPKTANQTELTSTGRLTENGKFHRAAQAFKNGKRAPELVRVYEKLYKGLWSFNGTFELVDSWIESDGCRNVFRFRLRLSDVQPDDSLTIRKSAEGLRLIPSDVKKAVYERDGGKCRICGATNELHFDHILPFSKGGSSNTAANVQLLCARHNLQKSDKFV